MNAPIEQEEDYRVKNARLGLALYIPGKSVEEIMAVKKKTEGAGDEITLTLNTEDAAAFYRAADDVEYLFGVTDTFMETLRAGISGGFLSGNENGLNALLELGARGLRHATEHEGRLLSKLGMRFRDLGVKYSEEA